MRAEQKAKGLPVTATTSINHLSFNEIDIGDYRTFCKLDPPLRSEDDRQAVIEAVASGRIEIIVSGDDGRAVASGDEPPSQGRTIQAEKAYRLVGQPRRGG